MRKLTFRSIWAESFFCEVSAKGTFQFRLVSSLIVMFLVVERLVDSILKIEVLVSLG